MPPPEIIDTLLDHDGRVGDKLRVKKAPALESIFLEHSSAETVDGENSRLVEGPQRFSQEVQGRFRRRALLHQLLQK